MYKYTPKISIIREMISQRHPGQSWWDVEFSKRMQILKKYGLPQDFTFQHLLRDIYPNMIVYNPAPLKYVLVRGYLFPAAMFNEEKL